MVFVAEKIKLIRILYTNTIVILLNFFILITLVIHFLFIIILNYFY